MKIMLRESKVLLALVICCTLASTMAGPVWSSLRIKDCSCSVGRLVCNFEKIGYKDVDIMFSSGPHSCTSTSDIVIGGSVVGSEESCEMSQTSGTFTVRAGAGQSCGKNYDSVTVDNCDAGAPCSDSWN